MKDSLSSLKSQFPHLTAVEARYDAKARERRQIIDSIMDRQNGIGLRLHPHLPQFITSLSTTLGFDPGMTARLIRHESK